MRCPLSHAVSSPLYPVKLDLSFNQIGDDGAAELAKALSINLTLTWVCIAWHKAVWDEHTLHIHSSFALHRCIFYAAMQLALPRGSMSAAACDRLNHAWPRRVIAWW